MASVVQIELQVDSSGAVQAFQKMGAAGTAGMQKFAQQLSATRAATAQGATEVARLTAAIQANTAALTTMGSRGQQAFRTVGSHALTELDSVRLFRDEFGIHIPRSMEKVMAQSRLVMGALNGMQGLMIGLGGIGVFLALAREGYEFYKELSDVNSEMVKYAENAAKAAQTKLFDTGSVETMQALLQQTNAQIQGLNSKRRAAGVGEDGTGGVMQYLGYGYDPNFQAYTKGDDKQLATAHELNDQVKERLRLLGQSEEIQAREADGSARAAALVGSAARRAREQSEEAIASLRLQQTQLNERNLHDRSVDAYNLAKRQGADLPTVYQPDPHAGEAVYNESMRRIREKYSSEGVADTRRQSDEVIRAQAEADQAGVSGEARYYKEFQAQAAALKRQLDQSLIDRETYFRLRGALEKKYNNEAFQRVETQTRETDRRQRDTWSLGLTGIPAIQKKGDAAQANITSQLGPDWAHSEMAGATRGEQEANAERLRAIAAKQTDEEIQAEKQRFSGAVDAIMDQSNAHQAQGFARIVADQKKALDDLEKRYEEVYGKPGTMLYVQNAPELRRGQTAINNGADQQRQDLARKNAEETQKIEEQAARASLTPMLQREAEIRDQYNDRVRAYAQMLSDQEIAQNDFNARVLAAGREMQGQLAAEARQERDKLAAEIEPFFRHPLEALEKYGEQQAAKYLATTLQRVSGNGAADMMPGRRGGGLLGDLTGMGRNRNAGGGQSHDAARAAHDLVTMTVTASTVIINGRTGAVASAPAAAPGGVTAASPALASMMAQSSAAAAPGAAARSMPMRVRHADGSTSVIAVPAPSGSAASSSADVANYGFPNLAPGAPSGTFSTLPGATLGGIPGAGGDAMGTAPSGSLPSFSASGSSGSSGPSVTGRIGTGISEASQVLQLGGKLATGFGGGSSPGPGGVFPGTGGGDLGMDESAQQLGSDLFNLDKPAGTTAVPGSTAGNAGSSAAGAFSQAGSLISAGAGLFSAAAGNGGAGGALQGAESGAQLGADLAGPLGAVIGAAAGGLLGFIGLGGKAHAEQYYQKTVRPRIAADIMGFGMGSMDFQSAYNDLIALDQTARKDMKKFGMGGKSVWNGKVHPDIINAEHQLTREQKAGRSQYGMSAGQYHGGGFVSGFGDMATSPTEGWSHLRIGETVMHEQATDTHGDVLGMMLGGATRGQIAGFYGAQAMAPSYRATMQQSAFGGSGHTYNTGDTYHISAIDTQSFNDALMNSKHGVRAANNASYAENSGGSDFGG